MADDPLNTLPVPEQYLSPDQLRAAYLEALKGRQAPGKQVEFRSPWQVAGAWAQALADRRYQDQLMQVARQQSLQAGTAALGLDNAGRPSGGPGGSPSSGGILNRGAMSSEDDTGSSLSPVSLAALKLSAMGETGKGTLGGLTDISPDAGGSKSYGPMGLNSRSGSLSQFISENPHLGFTAEPGSTEFDQQWRQKATSDPSSMLTAHENWHTKHIMKGLTQSLTDAGVNPQIANDPRVQIYMADRKVQMGDVGLRNALRGAAGAQSPEDFISRISAIDKQNIPGNFQTYLRDQPRNIPGLVNRIDRRYAGSLSYRTPPQALQPQGPQIQGQGPTALMRFAPDQSPQPQNPLANGIPQNGPAGGPGTPAGTPNGTRLAQIQGAPQGAPQAPGTAPQATVDWTKPQQGTFIDPAQLPRRPYYNWNQIAASWNQYSPQQQATFQAARVAERQPLSYDLPGGGKVFYWPQQPQRQYYQPNIQHEQLTLPGGLSTQRSYVIAPTGEKAYLRTGGQGAPAPAGPQPSGPQPSGPQPSAVDSERPPLNSSPEELAQWADRRAIRMKTEETAATKAAESYNATYEGLKGAAISSATNSTFVKAAKEQLNDPNFYSGAFEGLNLGYKRLLAGLGIDPGAALPQEAFRKTMAANVGQQAENLRNAQQAMSGTAGGRIFQQQIELMEKAAQNPDNSIAANKYLTDISDWGNRRTRFIFGKAHEYATKHNGRLDVGFDKDLVDTIENYDEKDPHPKLDAYKKQYPEPAAKAGIGEGWKELGGGVSIRKKQ